jgi:hypothetical protein
VSEFAAAGGDADAGGGRGDTAASKLCTANDRDDAPGSSAHHPFISERIVTAGGARTRAGALCDRADGGGGAWARGRVLDSREIRGAAESTFGNKPASSVRSLAVASWYLLECLAQWRMALPNFTEHRLGAIGHAATSQPRHYVHAVILASEER